MIDNLIDKLLVEGNWWRNFGIFIRLQEYIRMQDKRWLNVDGRLLSKIFSIVDQDHMEMFRSVNFKQGLRCNIAGAMGSFRWFTISVRLLWNGTQFVITVRYCGKYCIPAPSYVQSNKFLGSRSFYVCCLSGGIMFQEIYIYTAEPCFHN